MNIGPMTILVIEDDIETCNKFIKTAKRRDDVEIVAVTGSDIEGMEFVEKYKPEGIILDLELNKSSNGNPNAFEFISKIRNLKYKPIIIVTTHINSERTYEILHRNKIDLIMYKEQPNYSCDGVFNAFMNYRSYVDDEVENNAEINIEKENQQENISKLINNELDLIGITSKLKGRKYIHDAIMYLIENQENEDDINVIRYIAKKYQKSESTITNGIQNAISHAWGKSSIDDLMKYYTIAVNYKTGEPTPMELIYYYVDKISKKV